MTQTEQELKQKGFFKDAFFKTMQGAEAYASKTRRQHSGRTTASATGLEPYEGIYVWIKYK